MGVSLPGGRDARWEFLPTHASLPDQQEFFKRGQGKRGGYLLSVSARGLFGFDAMTKEEARSALLSILEMYSYFLEEHGYTDVDWRAEEPYALDVFAHSSGFKTMVKLMTNEEV